jgi:hypothetical protein
MAKPTRVLRWASVSGRTEPTAAEKDDGLAEGDGLPAEYLNDSLGLAGDWTDCLDKHLSVNGIIPTEAYDGIITAHAMPDEFEFMDSLGVNLPLKCGDPGSNYHAVTLGFLKGHFASHACVVRRAVTQTVNTGDAIVWTSVVQDEDGILDSGTEDKFVVPADGQMWFVAVNVLWSGVGASAGNYRQAALYKNADGQPFTCMDSTVPVQAGLVCSTNFAGIIGGLGDPLAAGDELRVKVAEGEVGTADITVARFSMIPIGY